MRVDSFLSQTRIFKSRSLAAEAISSGMVFVNRKRAKPAAKVTPEAIVEIDTPRFCMKIEVLMLPSANMPKTEAASLYRLIEKRVKN